MITVDIDKLDNIVINKILSEKALDLAVQSSIVIKKTGLPKRVRSRRS